MSEPQSPAGRWRQGEAAVQGMIDRTELQTVEPSEEHARRLLTDAARALASAERNAADDPRTAYVNAYDAARLSIAAVLAKQGLRATTKGGHIAVPGTIEHQLGPNTQHLVRGFARLRRHRNDAEYADLDTPEFTETEAREACEDAGDVVSVHASVPTARRPILSTSTLDLRAMPRSVGGPFRDPERSAVGL